MPMESREHGTGTNAVNAKARKFLERHIDLIQIPNLRGYGTKHKAVEATQCVLETVKSHNALRSP